MRVVIDIEANSLEKPTEIWCIVCKNIDTGETHVLRNVTRDEEEKSAFLEMAKDVKLWVGHHIIGYDLPVLHDLLGINFTDLNITSVVDTLVVSKLVNYSRKGHSIEDYGEEFGKPKGKNHYLDFFKRWSEELETYCIRDVEIGLELYRHLLPAISHPDWTASINCEQNFQRVCNELHNNGFYFNSSRASTLLENVTKDLAELDKEILDAFPPEFRIIREIMPRLTKYGTINRSDFRWVKDGDLSKLGIKPGVPYIRGEWVPFNPSSPKQVVGVLNKAGWKPKDKTKTHAETVRIIYRLKYRKRSPEQEEELRALEAKLVDLEVTGWKINEDNLATLPEKAPKPARLLSKRIMLESRRRTLTEWLDLVGQDDRIHGRFYGLGAWTHRMAHQEPNMANVPNEYNVHDGSKKLLGGEMRALWRAPP